MARFGRMSVFISIPAIIFLALASLGSAETKTAATSLPHDHHSHRKNRRTDEGSTLSSRLGSAKEQLQHTLSLIHARYELDTHYGSQLFRTSNNIDPYSWDLIKYNIAHKMLAGNSTFLMVFGGSSVTAGHDNYYNQSYPYVFERRMKKAFEAMGIELVVRNIAQGANNCVPYMFCYESMGGMDPDFIGWEQSYNCGRDNGVFEYMARLGAWSHSPTAVYYSASGAWSPTSCANSEEPVPYCSEEWTVERASSPLWVPQINDVEVEKDAIIRFNAHAPSANRFSSGWRKDYPHVGAHGFNVWETNSECQLTKPDGKVVSCNGIDAAEGCSMKFMTKEATIYGQKGGKGANWHPPRAFHLLRGEAIAWIYSLIAFESVFMVEQNLLQHDGNVTKVLVEVANKLHELKYGGETGDLSPPKHCQAYHCQRPAICYTDFRPHYFEKDWSRPPSPSQLPIPTDLQSRTAARSYYRTHYNMTLREVVLGMRTTNNATTELESIPWLANDVKSYDSWYYEPMELSSWSLTYGYLDAKPFFQANTPAAGELFVVIDFRGSTVDDPLAWVCGIHKEDRLHVLVDLNVDPASLRTYQPPVAVKNITAETDNNPETPLPPSSNHEATVGERSRLVWSQVLKVPGTDCEGIHGLPSKQLHVLSIRTAAGQKHPFTLSHVILFP